MPSSTWKMFAFLGAIVGVLGCGAGPSGPEPQVAPQAETPPSTRPLLDAAAPPAPAPAPFPLDELRSYYAEGAAAEAQMQYRRQEYDKAVAALAKAAPSESTPQYALDVLAARIASAKGDFRAAGVGYARAAKASPDAAEYLHYEATRAFAKAGMGEAATSAAHVRSDGPWGADTEFLLAESARSRNMHKEAAERYQAYLGRSGSSKLASEARYRLGEVLMALGDTVGARAQWRALLVSDPTSTWASAKRADDATLEAKLSAAELYERGMAHFHANRNLESEKDLTRALRGKELDAGARCLALFHRAKSVFKERDYKRAAPKFVPAIAACQASGNVDYEVKSLYQAGITQGRLRNYKAAAAFFARIEKYSEHSYADDARLRQAEQALELGSHKEVTELLSSIPAKYPKGDMRAEAMWRLARRAYMRGEYESAEGWLRKQIRVVPIERNWWAEGQAHYWLGRSLAKQEKLAEAAEAYRACIRTYPLTYYSLQAFARLREGWPEVFEEMREEVAQMASVTPQRLKAREQYRSGEFRAALELAKLGLGDATRRQLAALGMSVPAGRRPATSEDEIDRLVATSALLDLAGDYEHSHWIGRWHAVDYRRGWPTGTNRWRWTLAYPRAYWKLLSEFAETYTYPAHLQMAIVREESAFDPSRESWANAVGLTQMIRPTAIDHSKDSGIVVTRENLMHPVKNVTIGSHFLESLQQAFDGRVGLMVPGYNAGRARVRGWIRRRHGLDLDEFIEMIPGDQARRYTKRVLGSYFTYAYLGTGEIPEIRNAVPKALGKKR